MTQRFDGIVFDVDGVLADSEPLHAWAWRQVLTGHGVDVAPGELDRFIGIPCIVMQRYFQEKAPGLLPDTAIGEKQALFDQVMAERLQAVAGAPEVVKELFHRGIPLAAASNSPVGRVRDMLSAVGIWDCFTAAAGIDEVAQGKPSPDVYLLACRRLDLAPDRCLAVEDSPTGVRAAKAAGLTVWGFARDFSPEALTEAGADTVIHSLAEVPGIWAAAPIRRSK